MTDSLIDTQKITEIGTDLKVRFDAIAAETKAKMDMMRLEVQATMGKLFQDVFTAIPELYAITWVQYTPYFNDGDECTFRVGDIWAVPHVMREAWEQDGGTYAEEYAVSKWLRQEEKDAIGSPERIEAIIEAVKLLSAVMALIPDETFRSLWGDHVAVKVTADKISTEEYEHE